jgi:transposase
MGADDGGLTSDVRQELAELRRENRRLCEDVDILKRPAALVNGLMRPLAE